MTWFKINLNQLEDTSVLQRKRRRAAAGYLFFAVLLPSLAAGVIWMNVKLGEKVRRFSDTADAVQEQIAQLEQHEQYIGEEDVLDLYDLTRERIFWTEKLEALAVVVDTAVALSGIQFSRGRLSIRGITHITGPTSKFTAISSFIDVLKSQPTFSQDFSRIEFASSSRISYMDRDLMQFEVICYRE